MFQSGSFLCSVQFLAVCLELVNSTGTEGITSCNAAAKSILKQPKADFGQVC